MKTMNINDIKSLTHQEVMALEELVSKINTTFRVKNLILFGSKARGDSNENSDVDVLLIIDDEVTKAKRNKLSELSFEVNYKYDTNIYAGLSCSSKWEDEDYLKLPLPSNIAVEGIHLHV